MDINHDLFDSVKYLLGILASAAISMWTWTFKKRAARMANIEESLAEVSGRQTIFDVELRALKEDITEIKTDLKKVLYKL